MTREEAIKIIDCYDIGFYDLSGEKIPADKLVEAFDMAIEALDRQKGKWIDFSTDVPTKYVELCGNCNNWSYGMGKHYCPKCGADMRERKEE